MSSMKSSPRQRAAMLMERARGRLMAPETDDRMRAAGLRVLGSAERAMAQLERAAGTLESAARLEKELLSRLVPIVDDLGELVRHTLDEARERRGLPPRHRGTSDADDLIIDVEAD